MIFPYKKTGDSRYAPIVPIALHGSHRWILFNAFVDSGADFSVFHEKTARMLGISLRMGVKKIVTVGNGDDLPVSLHIVRVQFAGYVFKANIAFSAGLGAGFNLLGRATFFEQFQVCFNDRDKILRVTPLFHRRRDRSIDARP